MALIFTKKEKFQMWFRLMRRYLFPIIVLLILMPLPIMVNNKMSYMAFTILLMGTFWMTEVIPLAATSLIPMVLLPLFGIRDTTAVVKSYFHQVTFLVFGGLVLAAAIEHQNLHRRFALRVLLLFGTNPKRLILGFMSATAFLSAWMSNTAVTAMMLPIARAVLDEVGKQDMIQEQEMQLKNRGKLEEKSSIDHHFSSPEENCDGRIILSNECNSSTPNHSKRHKLLRKAITLCIAYAASLGGTASLVGTPGNVICLAYIENMFGRETGLNFLSWMLFCFPQMIVCIIVIWLWLVFMYIYLPNRSTKKHQEGAYKPEELRKVIRREYEDLGPIRFAEWALIGHFVLIILLWITQDPQVFPGWGALVAPGVGSATPSVLIALSLFMFPSVRPLKVIQETEQKINDMGDPEVVANSCDTPNTVPAGENNGIGERKNRQEQAKLKPIPALMNWDEVHEKMPWGVLLIAGSGFALAEGSEESGLSTWIAEGFAIFYGVSPFAMAAITSIAVSLVTELAASAVTITLFLPILAEMAVAMRINPLYILVTATVSACFAFMLPVACPPNTLAFSSKEITVIDMVKTGCLLNFTCIGVLLLFMNSLGRVIFNISEFPDWADIYDVTGTANTTDIYNLSSTTTL